MSGLLLSLSLLDTDRLLCLLLLSLLLCLLLLLRDLDLDLDLLDPPMVKSYSDNLSVTNFWPFCSLDNCVLISVYRLCSVLFCVLSLHVPDLLSDLTDLVTACLNALVLTVQLSQSHLKLVKIGLTVL